MGITTAPVGFNTWVTREFTIGSTSATTVIRLRGNPGSGNNIGVDNFRIIPAPTCTAPTALRASVTGAGAVEVSWTCASCTGSYFVEYGPTGFTLGSGTVAGPFTNSPASITGLANGNYHAYVRQDCGIDGIRDNAGPSEAPSWLATSVRTPSIPSPCHKRTGPSSAAPRVRATTHNVRLQVGQPGRMSCSSTTSMLAQPSPLVLGSEQDVRCLRR
ncbi:MAG: hypothetical protein IPO87_02675 [Flavobacteriales bacterium]|nr:hypothetical protein [Flavobacteriales bacterium]